MYTDFDYKTKKALIADFKEGKKIRVYQPGPFAGSATRNGTVCLEGPHYPKPHTWYAEAEIKDGIIVKVK